MWNCVASASHWFGGMRPDQANWLLSGLLVVGVLAFLLFWRTRRDRPSADRNDSLEILKIRLAKGEISIEEYETLKKTL